MQFYVDFEYETDDGEKAFVEGECSFTNELNFRQTSEFSVDEVSWSIVDENGKPIRVNEVDEQKIEKKVIKLAEKELF